MGEIEILVYMALWTLTLAGPGTVGLLMAGGFPVGLGNRDSVPEIPAWAARANRAHRNALENLPVFATLILAATIAGVSNENTLFGAQLFFWARIAHGIVYIAGIPYIRTAAFVASIVGMLRIAVEVLG